MEAGEEGGEEDSSWEKTRGQRSPPLPRSAPHPSQQECTRRAKLGQACLVGRDWVAGGCPEAAWQGMGSARHRAWAVPGGDPELTSPLSREGDRPREVAPGSHSQAARAGFESRSCGSLYFPAKPSPPPPPAVFLAPSQGGEHAPGLCFPGRNPFSESGGVEMCSFLLSKEPFLRTEVPLRLPARPPPARPGLPGQGSQLQQWPAPSIPGRLPAAAELGTAEDTWCHPSQAAGAGRRSRAVAEPTWCWGWATVPRPGATWTQRSLWGVSRVTVPVSIFSLP